MLDRIFEFVETYFDKPDKIPSTVFYCLSFPEFDLLGEYLGLLKVVTKETIYMFVK